MKSKYKFPPNRDVHAFLSKPLNKVLLQALIKAAFKTKSFISTNLIYCHVDKPARNLTSHELLENLTCVHAEVNAVLVFLYIKLRCLGYLEAVAVDTSDTVNFV